MRYTHSFLVFCSQRFFSFCLFNIQAGKQQELLYTKKVISDQQTIGSDRKGHLSETVRTLHTPICSQENSPTYSPLFLNGGCRLLLIIVFRTKPTLGKMSHYYYRGNRHPIKMSYLLVILQVNKHIPEIHQEKRCNRGCSIV